MHSSAHTPTAQPLKIKLTVPPSIQNKVRSLGSAPKKSRIEGASVPSSGFTGSSSASSRLTTTPSTAGHGQRSLSDTVGPKRKGRSRLVAMARDGTPNTASNLRNFSNEATTLPQSQSHLSSHTHSHKSAASRATRLQLRSSKSKLVASRQPSKSQAKGTIAKRSVSSNKEQDLHDPVDSDIQPSDDGSSAHFPTFVSADGFTSDVSESSESGSDSESGFGSDVSLAAEEENYIVAEQRRHDKARIRRELLGDDAPKHKDPNNSWVIRPRKRSVGLSDVDMEGDSDEVTEEDDDEDEEMDEDEEDDEAEDQASRVYTGLATGWSDDEESSFDADLFFANLTDTSSDDDSSETDGSHLNDSATDPLANSVNSLRSADFEVTEAWDGQIVFTNGPNDGQGILDLAFEANAAQLFASDSASVSHSSDVEMRTSDDAEDELNGSDSEFGESDGDTTEEELVDEQGLPTSRAMKLFRWPNSISSINPMSTVSPSISPVPISRRQPSSTLLGSPRPADILAGRMFWEDTDHPHPEGSGGESPRSIARVCIPVMGEFCVEGSASQKAAVLTGVNKDVPSPYIRRRRRFSSSAGSFSSVRIARVANICQPHARSFRWTFAVVQQDFPSILRSPRLPMSRRPKLRVASLWENQSSLMTSSTLHSLTRNLRCKRRLSLIVTASRRSLGV